MKRATRVAVIVTILAFHIYFTLKYLDSISEVWSAISTSTSSSPGYQKYAAPAWMNATDKAVVMAKVEEEDTNWVAEFLPEYVLIQSTFLDCNEQNNKNTN